MRLETDLERVQQVLMDMEVDNHLLRMQVETLQSNSDSMNEDNDEDSEVLDFE